MQAALDAWWPNPAGFVAARWARENGVHRATVQAWPKRFIQLYGRHGGRAAEALDAMAHQAVEDAFRRFRDGWDDPQTKPADRRADLELIARFLGVGRSQAGGGGDVNVSVGVTVPTQIVFECAGEREEVQAAK